MVSPEAAGSRCAPGVAVGLQAEGLDGRTGAVASERGRPSGSAADASGGRLTPVDEVSWGWSDNALLAVGERRCDFLGGSIRPGDPATCFTEPDEPGDMFVRPDIVNPVGDNEIALCPLSQVLRSLEQFFLGYARF